MSEKLIIGGLLAAFVLSLVACSSAESSYIQDNFENSLQELQRRDYDANNAGYDYLPPTPVYTPAPSYGPPSNTYLPAPAYGPPGYYPPAPHSQSHLNFFEKLKTKLSLYAIGKILLKLLIFKKIVKFIGLICLLLFLPKLKSYMHDEDSSAEAMNTKEVETDQDVLNNNIEDVYKYVTKALSLDFGDDDAENDDEDDVDKNEESSENNQENDDEDGDNEDDED